ncbi:MAG: hypothetical protein H7Y10_01735 [Flavobacterium sp.]|nr:hypothetical protein [Flavobacterium sp.]
MNRILFFIFILCISSNVFGQAEFNTKFRPIKPQTTTVKPKDKKDIPPPTNLPKLNIPKIVAPNVLKETNIFGTKPTPNNAFEIGTPENHFSMTPKNKFEHKLGDVYQEKMTKDLEKTMVREGLKEDLSSLDRRDRYLGDYKTKSEFLMVKYRDYIQIDGDLINVYLNDKLIQSQLYLYSQLDEFKIPLGMGINNIEFVVASQGTSGGNTAEIHVIDDKAKPMTNEYWNNLALGTRIKLLVIKE